MESLARSLGAGFLSVLILGKIKLKVAVLKLSVLFMTKIAKTLIVSVENLFIDPVK